MTGCAPHHHLHHHHFAGPSNHREGERRHGLACLGVCWDRFVRVGASCASHVAVGSMWHGCSGVVESWHRHCGYLWAQPHASWLW